MLLGVRQLLQQAPQQVTGRSQQDGVGRSVPAITGHKGHVGHLLGRLKEASPEKRFRHHGKYTSERNIHKLVIQKLTRGRFVLANDCLVAP